MLPILESLTNGASKASRKTGYGRSPSVLVLLPTRELAKQVNFYYTSNIQGIYDSLKLYVSNTFLWVKSRWLLTLIHMV